MNYLKSALVGSAAVIVILGVLPVMAAAVKILISVLRHSGSGFGIAIGPVRWHSPSLAQGLVMFAVFLAAFLWELRRLAK